MDWHWAVGGVTDETPRTMGPECENYLSDRRRWTEAVLFCTLSCCIIIWATKHLEPIQIPDSNELKKPHSATRLILLILMTFIFGIEMGFKLAHRNVIFVLNPCHIQTLVQIYILAAQPNKLSITLFRIQMNNLNGPFLASIFPEVEGRTLPFEQATYWIQHAMLYIIPAYILKTAAYKVEDLKDFKWAIIGVNTQLIYYFGVLNFVTIRSGINLNKLLCADESDPFQGDNYRIAAVIHQSILCPLLNKLTVHIFGTPESIQHYGTTTRKMQQTKNSNHQQKYSNLTESLNENCQPRINSRTYFPGETTATTTTSQLIHRKSNSLNYQNELLQENEVNKEAVFKGDYILEPDGSSMEVIGPSSKLATNEYSMLTTKID